MARPVLCASTEAVVRIEMKALADQRYNEPWEIHMLHNSLVYFRKAWRLANMRGRATAYMDMSNLPGDVSEAEAKRRMAGGVLAADLPPGPETVYALASRSTLLLKIGKTTNLHSRLATFKTGDATGDLCLVAYAPLPKGTEKKIHEALRPERVSARGEWFHPTWASLFIVSDLRECWL